METEIVVNVILQHAEEAAFHWLLRDAAVTAPHYSLKDLAKLDGRVEAHLDGLRIAGNEGWEFARKELAWEEQGEVFVAGVLALESNIQSRIDEILSVIIKKPELARGFISAMGWLPYDRVRSRLADAISSSEPVLRRIGIASAAIHRRDPGQAAIAKLLNDNDVSVRARALRAAGELGAVHALRACQSHLVHEDINCKFWAAWSAALLGDFNAAGTLRQIAEANPNSKYAESAADLAARRMQPAEALAWHKRLAAYPNQLRLAIKVASALGDPAVVPWLIQQMGQAPLARPAGEAFTMITGIDLAYDDLEGDWPEGFEAGPTEDPDDDNVAMDADGDLPFPAPELVNQWWAKHQVRFPAGTRHLLGKAIAPESLQDALANGRQRQRAAAALEIALREPGRPLYEVRARGDWQR